MAVRNMEVKEVHIAGMRGFQVQCMFMDCSDGMFQPLAHAAVFKTRARAEAFMARITPSWKWDWSQWGCPVGAYFSRCDAIQAHVAPYSVLPCAAELTLQRHADWVNSL